MTWEWYSQFCGIWWRKNQAGEVEERDAIAAIIKRDLIRYGDGTGRVRRR